MGRHRHEQGSVRNTATASDRWRPVPSADESQNSAATGQLSAGATDGQFADRAADRDTERRGEDRRAEIIFDGRRDDESIRRLAYDRYLRRNGVNGNAESDWLAAEAEIKARRVSAD